MTKRKGVRKTHTHHVFPLFATFCVALAKMLTARVGVVVARINRKLLSGRDVLFGQQTYGVEIAPGVDMALMAALAICLDESQNDK